MITKQLLALLFVLIVAFVALLLLGDRLGPGEQSAPIALENVIPPRNEGAVWHYKSAYFENGQAQPNGTSLEEVVETKEIAGVICYHVRLKMDWRSLKDKLLGVKLEEGDYWYFWEVLS